MRNAQLLLTSGARRLAESKNPLVKSALISLVKNLYKNKFDMSLTDKLEFSCFDDFFTRDFKPGVREISQASFVNPVDGLISDFGKLDSSHSIVIKHKPYSPMELLLEGELNSNYVSYYLAPYNHHQIYMPVNGKIIKSVYIPGLLHSVKPAGESSKRVVNFKNERLVLFIDSDSGPVALVLVGALLVGSMSTAWGKRYTPNRNQDVVTENLDLTFSKGDSIARFHYGSSVILVTQAQLGKIALGSSCNMGAPIWS